MRKRIDQVEWLAGALMLGSLSMTVALALRMELSLFRVFFITIGLWLVQHLLWPLRKKLTPLLWMGMALLTPLGLHYLPDQYQTGVRLRHEGYMIWGDYLVETLHLESIPDFVSWFVDAFYARAEGSFAAFESVLILLLSLVVITVTYRLIFKGRHFGWFLFPIAFYMQQWYNYTEGISLLFSMYFVGFLAIAGSQVQWKYLQKDESDKVVLVNYRKHKLQRYLLVFGLVFVVLGNLVTAVVPVGSINSALSELVPNIVDVRTGYAKPSMQLFSFGKTMYEPYPGSLGGPVEPDTRLLILKVFSDRPTQYLRGRAMTRYNGERWFNENTAYTNYNDFPERLGESYDLDDRFEITVLPQNIQTMTLFAPLGVAEIDLNEDQVFSNSDDALYYKRKSFEGGLLSYTVRSVGSSMLLEDRDRYLELPRSYDNRIKTLAADITKGLETDREKMTALTNYLRETYPYNLNVSVPPPGVDFVAHFLFDEKQGYCTYFATALSTMGRSVGVPTRYVNGYLLPNKKARDGTYDVYGDRAHAWTEAYIEGEGWQIFEATPAYAALSVGTGASENEIEAAAQEETGESTGGQVNPGELPENLDFKEGLLEDEFEGIDFSGGLQQEEQADYTGIMLVVLYGALGLGALAGLVIVVMTKRYFDFGPLRKRAVRYIYYVDQLIEEDGLSQSPGSRLRAYLINMPEHRRPFSVGSIGGIIDKINKLLYGQGQLNAQDMIELQKIAKAVERNQGAMFGKMSYWMSKR